ncbi:MAG: hypothetical protein HQ508_02795 [Candidatus Marinimicrobia bacterium]|nr:hypothetical protein [Candidatus Neomarinimicrobiota bacterium]
MKNTFKYLLLIILALPAIGQNHVLSLDGIDDYVDFSSAIVNSNSFTIEAWLYLNGPGGGIQAQNPIFEQRTDATGCNHSAVSYFAESHSYEQVNRFALRGDTECSSYVQHYTPAYGDWHHYSVVQDGNYSSLFIDGLLMASLFYEHSGSYANNIDYVTLGQAIHDGASYGSLNGMLDEVRIWDRPLTIEDIQGNMYQNLNGDETGLIAYCNFEGSNTEVLDQSNHGHLGALHNGAQIIEADYLVVESLWGDLNQDGQVNISDVIALINHILGF